MRNQKGEGPGPRESDEDEFYTTSYASFQELADEDLQGRWKVQLLGRRTF